MTRPPPPATIRVLGSSATRTPTGSRDVSRPAPPALGQRSGPDLIDVEILLEVLDSVVRGIFSVALTVSAARSLTDGPATARLDQALDELDDLVRELRHTALSAHLPTRTRSRPRVEPAQPTTSTAELTPDLVRQATGALTEVDAVLVRLGNDVVAGTGDDPNAGERITNAARHVRLAKNTLAATAII